MVYGIDISEHNGDINLSVIKPAFVIIRCGYSKTQDRTWLVNVSKCEQLSIPYGLYWYSYALNTEQAKQEALAMNKCIEKCKPTLGLWYDMEDGDGFKGKNGFNTAEIPAIINAFRTHINYDVNQVGVYCSKSWLKYLGTSYEGPLWIAEWGTNDGTVQRDYAGTSNVYFLQFTSKYMGMNLDGDVMYKSFNKVTLKDLLYMAIDTLDGMYGNGDDRKKRLGSYYNDVQEIINDYYGKGYAL